jgi:predicted ester cyclase
LGSGYEVVYFDEITARVEDDHPALMPLRWHPPPRTGSMLLVECERAELEAFYRRYLQRCNEHRFDELGEFVDENVEVNGAGQGLWEYAKGLGAFVEALPDYHWDLRHLLIDGCWLSAHLVDTGTTPAGWSISVQEFALYRVAGGRIIEAWGDLDRSRLAI